ncbi:hypothetical protein B5K05_13280 [Rhizobium phaseoli]|uniref:hypothetical protein n=1 Tax=Rhizobium phaseoli TaxID=396 RepID=UPI000E0D1CFC|nr:hypothetical protein [Rhizobium phaseoli]RDJ10102.1 hypothetical protein B5K04_13255 [Rhizobium phaseoli]RDJ14102.1 hypothetical protein B5K05_13280 [Rhizobium phaseoli]
MDIDGAHYRFTLQAERMLVFFNAYQAERHALGISTTLCHVTAQQRIDTITAILGLNADGGWRRIGDEGPNALWLRYIRPVLAETRESSAALASTLERYGLPGKFEPDFEEPPGGTVDVPPGLRSGLDPPPGPMPEPWRLALGAAVERLRNVLVRRAWIVAVGLAALAIVLIMIVPQLYPQHITKINTDPPIPRSCSSCPQPEPSAVVANKSADQLAQDAYRSAIELTVNAIYQKKNDITPRELAEIYAGESDHIDRPELFLAAMLNRWPLPPDRSISLDAPKYRVLQEYAAAAASVENNLPIDPFEALVEDPSQTVPLLAPPDKPLPPTNHALPANHGSRWWPYLAFLPLLLASAWILAGLPHSLKAGLRNAMKGTTGTPIRLPVGVLTDTSPRRPRRLARLLSQRDAFPGRRLNGERTVLATIAQGGFPTLIMRPAMRTVDYVFLVARRHRHDHERDRVIRLIDALKRGGVPLFVYDYDPDPRTLAPLAISNDEQADLRRRPAKLDMRALRELHGNARLVLVTDGRELVDFFTQRPLPFVAALRAWPGRMLLTPVPIADWGLREMNLSEALDVRIGRATEEGFRDLAQVFRPSPRLLHRQALRQSKSGGEAAPSLTTRLFNWLSMAEKIIGPDIVGPRPDEISFDDPALTSDTEPPFDFQKACVEAMRQWLGRPGFLWLAACAAYPQTRFNITLYLGLKLTFMTRSGPEPLYTERLLARLTILPWFRTGRMPPWLRRILFEALTPAAKERVLAAVDELLQGKAPAGVSSQHLIDLTIWRPENRALDIPPDAVLADMMITTRSGLVPVIQGERFREIFRSVLSRALIDRFVITGTVALWCLAAWWLWPRPQDAPHPIGSWLPFAILLTAAVCGIGCLGVGLIWRRRTVNRNAMRILSSPGRTAGPADGEMEYAVGATSNIRVWHQTAAANRSAQAEEEREQKSSPIRPTT